MSRTLKDRPYWVLKNDPKMDRYAIHHHLITHRELVGYEPIMRTDGLGNEVLWYMAGIYNSWSERVDCTLDLPESPSDSRFRNDKHCCYWLEYYPNIRSNKDIKQLTNGALRSKVRQQLREAILDGDWEAVDIHTDCKYIWYGWWD